MLSIQQMRDKVRLITGEDSTDLDDTAADVLLNQAWWEIIDKFPFREKERTDRFDMEIGRRDYPTPQPFEAIQTISVVTPEDGAHRRLERMTTTFYEENFREDTTVSNVVDQKGIPQRYFRRGDGMVVWPTPDKAYETVIYYLVTLADLEKGDVDFPVIPQVWHEIIYLGGTWRRLIELGDFARSREIKNHQIALINSTSPVEAKEEQDTHLGGVDLPPELTEHPTGSPYLSRHSRRYRERRYYGSY